LRDDAWRAAGEVLRTPRLVFDFVSQGGDSGGVALAGAGNALAIVGSVTGNTVNAAGGDYAAIVVPTRSRYYAMLERLGATHVPTALVLPNSVTTQGKPHERSWLYKAPLGAQYFILGFQHKRSNFRSRWEHPEIGAVPAVRALCEEAGSTQWVAPLLQQGVAVKPDDELVFLDPYVGRAVGKTGDFATPVALTRRVLEEYLDRLFDLTPAPETRMAPLTVQQAVFGCPGYRAMDLTRSAGADGGRKLDHVDLANKAVQAALEQSVADYEEACMG